MNASQVAERWHFAVYEGAMQTVWGLTTPIFRLVLTQTVMHLMSDGPERDALARAAAQNPPSGMSQAELAQFWAAVRSVLVRDLVPLQPREVGTGQTAQVEAPMTELVRRYWLQDLSIDPATGAKVLLPDRTARAFTFVMQYDPDEHWLVAGVGSVYDPGWPPTRAWRVPDVLE